MDENIDAYKEEIRRTFDLIKPIAAEAASIFYSSLWEVDPSTKVLFKNTDMKKQGLMLMKTLGLAVGMLNNMQKLRPVLQSLGRRHVSYGVTADMYPSVAEALLLTLDKGLGDECTQDTKEAWDWALGVISGVCIEAAREIDPEYGQAKARVEEPKTEKEGEEQEEGERAGGEEEEDGREKIEDIRGEEPKVEESTCTSKERTTTDGSNTDGNTTDESTTEENTTGTKKSTAITESTKESATSTSKQRSKNEITVEDKITKEGNGPAIEKAKGEQGEERPQSDLKLKLHLKLEQKDVAEEIKPHQAIQCPCVRLAMTAAQLAEME